MKTTQSHNIAAIDVGTNSFHLIVVKVKDNGNFEIIDREKEVIRLSEGSTGDIKTIKPEAIERAIICLKRFKGIADSHNAKVRAVATSAVREAHNRNEFIEKVHEIVGIDIEVVSGQEEARLIYLGVLKAVPVYNKKALVIDIGGGSTEFYLGKKGNPIYSVSIKLGAVRLTQKFFPDFEINKQRIEECRKWIRGEVFPVIEHIKKEGLDHCIGSSGTIMAAGFMINAKRKYGVNSSPILNNFVFTKEELFSVADDVLSKKSVSKRKKISGLDEKRADIIPAGILILQTIFELLNIDSMTISGYALREGIIIDSLQKMHSDSVKPVLHDIRKESVISLAKSCRYDLNHCMYITNFALQLFDQLKDLHQLNDEHRELIEAAGILHDIGYHIAHTNHHHHSYYIIKNSELLGFNENEIDIIAHISRYHRKSHPKPSHKDFNELPMYTQIVVKKLAAILRVADSLDRTHRKVISGLNASVKNGRVEIKVKLNGNIGPDIELWNLDRRKGLFEEVFNKEIVIKK